MLVIAAAILWIITALRLPVAMDPHRGSVFRTTLFAAIACTLYVLGTFNALDPVLGGHNREKLPILVFLILGFWQFRNAILLAIVPESSRRLTQLVVGRLAVIAAIGTVTTGFFLSPFDSEPDVPLSYSDHPGMMVFLWAGAAFLLWICADIARVCHQHVPAMHSPIFRCGFRLMGLGCAVFCIALLGRLLFGIVSHAQGSGSVASTSLGLIYSTSEITAVVLVGVGLLVPRVVGPLSRGRIELQARFLLIQVRPVWTRLTADRHDLVLESPGSALLSFFQPHPERRLHRWIIEIRDCELAAKSNEAGMRPQEIALVERAEKILSWDR